MNALIILLNLALFAASFVGGVAVMHLATEKRIGYFTGARCLGFSKGDAMSIRRHRYLIAALLCMTVSISALSYQVLGYEPWSWYCLSATIGSMLGEIFAFWSDRYRLLPADWPRTK